MSEAIHASITGSNSRARETNLILKGKWYLLARIAWILLAIAALAMFITSLPGYVDNTSQDFTHLPATDPSITNQIFHVLKIIASLSSVLISFTLAGFLFIRRFDELMSALISYYLLIYGVVMAGVLEVWTAYWLDNFGIATFFQSILLATPTFALLVLFPTGRFVPRWTRWVLLISVSWNAIFFLLPDLSPVELPVSLPIPIAAVWFFSIPCLGIYAQFYRYRYVSTPDERQQSKVVIFGLVVWMAYMLISSIPYFYLINLPPDVPVPWWASLSELLWFLSLNILPVSLTIAITHYRLWNLDIVINRSLVYITLTATIIALYIFIVGGLGIIFQTSGNFWLSILAVVLAAASFHPIRLRLQATVNKMMYGQRDNPAVVLTQLGSSLEKTGTPEDALHGIVKTIAQTLKLPYVAIHLEDDAETTISYGLPSDICEQIPLTYQTEIVGQLILSGRAPGEALTQKDRQILEDIARQAGAAAQAAKLTHELQHARQRLVNAREEERHDLHDGLGPQLASLTLSMDALEKLVDRGETKAAKSLVQDLKAQSTTAIEDIRRLIYELRPPTLDDLGLVQALEEQASRFEQSGLRISINSQLAQSTLPAAVELAAYRIVLEALNNVSRHAGADTCNIEIRGDENTISIRIVDNGSGISSEIHPGVGLLSMGARAKELGGRFRYGKISSGGTFVEAALPINSN
jgi:signal transduction histidine kinase